MAQNKSSKDKLKEVTDNLEAGIKEVFESEKYKAYLNTMAKFHQYSYNNIMLISMQKPNASLVAGFNTWKNKFQRTVNKGEKGIRILAPAPYKIKREMERTDSNTHQPIKDKNGKAIKDEVEIVIPAFKVVSVFDVSQTSGKELDLLEAQELKNSVADFKTMFQSIYNLSPVPISFEEMDTGSKGYYHLRENRIAIKSNMSEAHTIKTAIHEVSHAILHNLEIQNTQKKDASTKEVEAESIAYTVCQHFGIDTSDYSFTYLASWSSGKEMPELKSSLETIKNTASKLIDNIQENLQELINENEEYLEETNSLAL